MIRKVDRRPDAAPMSEPSDTPERPSGNGRAYGPSGHAEVAPPPPGDAQPPAVPTPAEPEIPRAEPARARAAMPAGVRFAVAMGAVLLLAGAFLLAVAAPPVQHPPWPVAFLGAALLVGGVALMVLPLRFHIRDLEAERAQLLRRESEAKRLAESDPLTGLGNYRMFWRRLGAEVARTRRHGEPFSLVILDLDGFKEINDALGHQVGDQALRSVADALRAELRAEDVCCRQGGDEFAVIAVGAGDEVRDVAERLVRAVGEVRLDGVDGRLGASAGWATFGRPAASADDLIARADEAMRRAKREGAAVEPGAAPAPVGTGAARPRDTFAALAGLSRALAGARDERTIAQAAADHLHGALDAERVLVLGAGDPPATLATAAGTEPEPLRPAESAAVRAALRGDIVPAHGAVAAQLTVPVLVAGEPRACLLAARGGPGGLGGGARAVGEGGADELSRALRGAPAFAALSGAELGAVHEMAAAIEPGEERWRAAELAWTMGRELRLDATGLRALYLAALFHDIGLLGVPLGILGTPGPLGARQLSALRRHPEIGAEVLSDLPVLREAARIVRHEHERPDGGGYPDGLRGAAIPLPSRILLACSTWVALTSDRPWRLARPAVEARAEIAAVTGTQLDSAVADALLRVVGAGAPDAIPA